MSAAADFLELHHGASPLLLPNVWDVGSTRLMESLGFTAVGTTSSGFAASRGQLDGRVGRELVLEHLALIAAAAGVPVNADLENGFADDPAGVAETVSLAAETGVAAVSIEDFSGDSTNPIYELRLAAERISAAAEAASSHGILLVGRAENFLHGRQNLSDTIARLQAYQEAGADVLYAPGLSRLPDITAVVTSVDRPVNVLAVASCPPVAELAKVGVARVSVGGAFAFAALGAVSSAAREFLDDGTYSYLAQTGHGKAAATRAFDPNPSASKTQ